MAGGTNTETFFQYSNGIADASYQFDYVKTITIAANGTAIVTFPAGSNILRMRSITVEDVTAAVGGTAPSLIACYYRIDGNPAGTGVAADGSASRIVKPGERQSISRYCPQESGVTIKNPNAAAVTIMVELGA